METPANITSSDTLYSALEPFVRGRSRIPARTLKENRVRSVWRIDLDPWGPLLVKHYRYLRAYDRFRYRFLKDKAQREAENLARLSKLGLPVAEPLLWKGLEPNESLFACRFIENASRFPAHPPKRLVAELARTVRKLHEAKFYHRDLHLGNVLLAGGKVYLIDFHSGIFLPFFPVRVEVKTLAMLADSFRNLGDPDLIPFFLKEYAGGRYVAGFEQKVLKGALKRNAVHLRSRSKRCIKESTLFTVQKQTGKRIFRKRELKTEQLEELLSAPGRPAWSPHSVRDEETACEEEVQAGGETWLRSRIHYNLPAALKAALKGGLAYRAWRSSFAARELEVLEPYACFQRRRLGLLREEVLISERPGGFVPLAAFMRSLYRDKEDFRKNCRLIAKDLALFIARFHATGLWWPRLSSQKILLRPALRGWQFRLRGLYGARFRTLTYRRALENLVALAAVPGAPPSRLAMLRFLRHYRKGALWNRKDLEELKDLMLRRMFMRIVETE